MLHAYPANRGKRILPANYKSGPIALVLSLVMSTAAFAQFDTGQFETVPNNDFSTAQFLDAGNLTVSGELAAPLTSQPIAQQMGTLSPGGVVSHNFVVTPGEAFTAAIDNSASGTDTTLGSFDEFFNLIDTDDDSSPVGIGLGSALPVFGNPDGSINLQVSGFPDFDFDGLDDSYGAPHQNAGDYELLLFAGDIDVASAGDVDVFAFTGLTPGARFFAETSDGAAGFSPDTVLGLFDDQGTLIATDDDGGDGFFSRLTGTVPNSGTLVLGVSGFADFGFTGLHSATGSYELSVEVVAVPEPTGISLLLCGVVGIGLRRRR